MGGAEKTGEERMAKIVVTFKLAAEQAAELAVEREQRIQLQVSFGSSLAFYWKFDFQFSRI